MPGGGQGATAQTRDRRSGAGAAKAHHGNGGPGGPRGEGEDRIIGHRRVCSTEGQRALPERFHAWSWRGGRVPNRDLTNGR
jgi:hypothetical protein